MSIDKAIDNLSNYIKDDKSHFCDVDISLILNALLQSKTDLMNEKLSKDSMKYELLEWQGKYDSQLLQSKKERELMLKLLEVAGCPNCDGSGQFYDGMISPDTPRVVKCDWCASVKELITKLS